MDNAFKCTQCGKCCHNLNIPLSISEAKDWLLKGHKLKILTEATPWVNDTPVIEDVLIRKKSMTFDGLSGNLSIRVLLTLVGYFDDGCPNLDAHQNCSVYESRPLTCRIYPFEMNPAIPLNPANKLCPSDAWQLPVLNAKSQANDPILLIDADTQINIQKIYHQSIADVESKKMLCLHLGISTCSLSNNGYLFHFVDQAEILRCIQRIEGIEIKQVLDPKNDLQKINWLIVTKNQDTLNDLISVGGNASMLQELAFTEQEFISLHN